MKRLSHLKQLLDAHKIVVVVNGSYEFDVISRNVCIKSWKDVESQEGYLSALHEIGHFVCGHVAPTDWNHEANMELAAWAWAFRHCKEPVEWGVVQKMLGYALLPSPI